MTQPNPAILDIWQTDDPSTAAAAFSAAPASPISRWQLDLPAAPPDATAQLATLEAQEQAVLAALTAIPARLAPLAAESRPGLPFGLTSLPAAEADLLAIAAELQGQVSFAPGQPSLLNEAGQQFRAGAERLFRLLSHLVWVETRAAGRLLGRTTVGWNGDTQTVWAIRAGSTQQALHRRNLQLALAARLLHLRLLLMSTRAAAQISLLLGGAGGLGAVVLLPVAWRYVNQVLREVETYREKVK